MILVLVAVGKSSCYGPTLLGLQPRPISPYRVHDDAVHCLVHCYKRAEDDSAAIVVRASERSSDITAPYRVPDTAAKLWSSSYSEIVPKSEIPFKARLWDLNDDNVESYSEIASKSEMTVPKEKMKESYSEIVPKSEIPFKARLWDLNEGNVESYSQIASMSEMTVPKEKMKESYSDIVPKLEIPSKDRLGDLKEGNVESYLETSSKSEMGKAIVALCPILIIMKNDVYYGKVYLTLTLYQHRQGNSEICRMKVAVASSKDIWQLWQYRHVLTCEVVGEMWRKCAGNVQTAVRDSSVTTTRTTTRMSLKHFLRFVEDSEVQN